MCNISVDTLSSYENWVTPSFQDVCNVFEKLNIDDKNFTKTLGLNERTYRRWTSKKNVNRDEKSSINYGAWCVLIALSKNKCIFANIEKRDLSQVPDQYICSLESFESPPKEILTLFVGKYSITGLQRTELASLFGWNSTYLGREFNKGKISFLNWVLLLLFCGTDIKKLIKIIN